jgi:hypothetical protein
MQNAARSQGHDFGVTTDFSLYLSHLFSNEARSSLQQYQIHPRFNTPAWTEHIFNIFYEDADSATELTAHTIVTWVRFYVSMRASMWASPDEHDA